MANKIIQIIVRISIVIASVRKGTRIPHRNLLLASEHAGERTQPLGKGKAKVLQDYSFNDNGILSQAALAVLEAGSLKEFDCFFKQPVVDLDAPVKPGILAKDILHHAVKGTLAEFLLSNEMCSSIPLDDLKELMSVAQVLKAFGFSSGVSNAAMPSSSNISL